MIISLISFNDFEISYSRKKNCRTAVSESASKKHSYKTYSCCKCFRGVKILSQCKVKNNSYIVSYSD